jgi:acyl carrier protein
VNTIYEEMKEYLLALGVQNLNDFQEEMDSLGFIEMIVHVEQTYNISIEDDYLLIENFDSIDKLCDYITFKQYEKDV